MAAARRSRRDEVNFRFEITEMKTPWILSAACGSGVHCHACRTSGEFRSQLAQSGRVTESDFACPYGVEESQISDLKFQNKNAVTAPRLSVAAKAKRLWRELRRWRRAGYPLASRAEQQRRLRLCEACAHYAPQGNFGLGQCRLCGCTRAKLWLASARCPHPDGARWSSVS